MIETIDGQVVEMTDEEYYRHRAQAVYENPDEKRTMEMSVWIDKYNETRQLRGAKAEAEAVGDKEMVKEIDKILSKLGENDVK